MTEAASLVLPSLTAPVAPDSAPLRGRRREAMVIAAAVLIAAVFPLVAGRFGHDFYVGFATRILIYVLAVSSLNLLVGFAGLVSFGHAAFLGVGAYTVAAVSLAVGAGLPGWAASAWVAWPLAMVASAALALVIGAVSLRTRHAYFIMTTLAFGQMVYFLFIGMRTFGSDNGMSLPLRSPVGLGLDMANDTAFYYVVLAVVVLCMGFIRTLVRSRFGVVIGGVSENEGRMEAIGFPVYRYKLACFVIAGALAGLAGALLANQSSFVSPRLLDWVQSGNLLLMLILGGVGYLAGGIYGVVVMLVLEEALAGYTDYWQFFVGLLVIAVVVFSRGGIAGVVERVACSVRDVRTVRAVRAVHKGRAE